MDNSVVVMVSQSVSRPETIAPPIDQDRFDDSLGQWTRGVREWNRMEEGGELRREDKDDDNNDDWKEMMMMMKKKLNNTRSKRSKNCAGAQQKTANWE